MAGSCGRGGSSTCTVPQPCLSVAQWLLPTLSSRIWGRASPIDASAWSTDDAVQAGGADEALYQNVDDAVSSAVVVVLAEAEALIDACLMLDTQRAVALIVRKLRDFGHLD